MIHYINQYLIARTVIEVSVTYFLTRIITNLQHTCSELITTRRTQYLVL